MHMHVILGSSKNIVFKMLKHLSWLNIGSVVFGEQKRYFKSHLFTQILQKSILL